MDISSKRLERVNVVKVSGRVDHQTAPDLEKALRAIVDFTATLIGARTTAHIDTAFDRLDAPASWMDEMNSWQNLRASLPGLKQILRNSLRLGVSAV